MNERNSHSWGAVIILILVTLCISGCTSSNQPISKPDQPLIRGEMTPVTDNLQKPSLTRPAVSVSLTKPYNTPMVNTQELYEDITKITNTLYALSQEWDPDGLSCSGNSCNGQFINSAGDTMTIVATLYDSTDAAAAAFNTAQSGHSGDVMVTLTVGDASYAWQHRNTSGAGIVRKNLFVSIDYTTQSGMASVRDAKQIAEEIGSNIAKL